MEAPKIPSMFNFRSKKPNRFYFEPRYYNERKEKLQQRYEKISREVNNSKGERSDSTDFKATLRTHWGNNYNRSKSANKMNKRVLIYVAVLLMLTYLLLY